MTNNNFGTVTVAGKEYALTNQPDFTGRLILDWQSTDGYNEFSAPAIDTDEAEYRVYWIIQVPEGCEDLSDLDWSTPSRVEHQ